MPALLLSRSIIFFLVVIISLVVHPVYSQSLGLCTEGVVTHYDPTVYADSCYPWTYGTTNNPSSVLGIAPNTPFLTVSGNLLRCGECYEITSNYGTAIYTVVSGCPDCETYYPHFDIRGASAFDEIIYGNGVGSTLVSFKNVGCPVTGGIIAMVRDSSAYYLSLIFRNQKYLIVNSEIMLGSSPNWTNMTIDGPGYWSASAQIENPIIVRVTSVYGEQILVNITTTTINDANQGDDNFGAPPSTTNDNCTYPVQTIVYQDELNSVATPYVTASNWQYVSSVSSIDFSSTVTPYAGKYCLQVVMKLYDTFQFYVVAPIPIYFITGINFWVRMDGLLGSGLLQFNLAGPSSNAYPPQVTIPLSNVWNYVFFNLSQFNNNYTGGFTDIAFQYDGPGSSPASLTVYFDNIFLNVTPNSIAPIITPSSPGNPPHSGVPTSSPGPVSSIVLGILVVMSIFQMLL